RYQPASGTVNASSFQSGAAAAGAAAPAAGQAVAPRAVGDMHIERDGNQRWLVTPLAADALWPQLQQFWKDQGLTLVTDDAATGVMETDWAENRANLPKDIIRSTIGRVFDSLYDTGKRDRFRTRVERTATGTEIYISHRGMVEVVSSQQTGQTVWQPSPPDPGLEAEMLSRLMLRLGAKEEAAKASAAAVAEAAAAPVGPAKVRVLTDRPYAAFEIDDGFDRAWRRVGLSLDRSGFTVEDRDRAQGLYYVRYVDPNSVKEPNFFTKLFSKDGNNAPARYRLSLKSQGELTTVAVLNAQGAPESGDAAKHIVKLLVEDLK
ncbi:MAG TPA: outer membrane protein assembly factor BamC, partial [Methylibium sp.]